MLPHVQKCQSACGILVKAREGRPIKVDGNPDHPVNKGKFVQRGRQVLLIFMTPQGFRILCSELKGKPLANNMGRSYKNIACTESQRPRKEIAIISHTITSLTAKSF
jgi:molybdopterin-containing oxidoreductase family iron-sulfur binding subunit